MRFLSKGEVRVFIGVFKPTTTYFGHCDEALYRMLWHHSLLEKECLYSEEIIIVLRQHKAM